jgi:outer membrane protein assembly factor BamB
LFALPCDGRISAIAIGLLVAALMIGSSRTAKADDWTRFRGPNGSGISPNDAAPPVNWGNEQNIKWKVELPGPGNSSPIVVGERVFLTCWTGYGAQESASQGDLRRHLLCIDRQTGRTLWSRDVEPALPEDEFEGNFRENGYASHSPVSDGERVYVFFGKTGALAFDLEGNQLWKTQLGTESSPTSWGSASSPIVHEDLLIVTAAAESESIAALNKKTGEVVWKKEAAGFSGTWGTPVLVSVDGRTEAVIAVPGELWSFDVESGQLLWYCEAPTSSPVSASVITHDGVIYVFGGRQGGSLAVKAGGSGDISESHILWRGSESIGIGTPLYYDGRIYWIARDGVVNCINAADGQRVYQDRLEMGGSPAANAQPQEGQAGGRRGGGGMRSQNYSSPVAAAGKLYFISRSGDGAVLALSDQFEQLATNSLGEENEEFNGTPAISDHEMYIRSDRRLYCIAETKP